MLFVLLGACSPTDKRYTIYCSNDYIGNTNSTSVFLSNIFEPENLDFFKRSPPDTSSLEDWVKAMKFFSSFADKKSIGEINPGYQPYNLCMLCQVEFYEDNKRTCFICIGEREELISINRDVYQSNKMEIESLKKMLKIECNADDPLVYDKPDQSVKEVSVESSK